MKFLDDEADSQTDGEELEKARAIRMQEVKVKPMQYLPTDTETEVRIQFSKVPHFITHCNHFFLT